MAFIPVLRQETRLEVRVDFYHRSHCNQSTQSPSDPQKVFITGSFLFPPSSDWKIGRSRLSKPANVAGLGPVLIHPPIRPSITAGGPSFSSSSLSALSISHRHRLPKHRRRFSGAPGGIYCLFLVLESRSEIKKTIPVMKKKVTYSSLSICNCKKREKKKAREMGKKTCSFFSGEPFCSFKRAIKRKINIYKHLASMLIK